MKKVIFSFFLLVAVISAGSSSVSQADQIREIASISSSRGGDLAV